jgi:hypothetical protein
MYRPLAIAVLLAAAAFLPSLEAQMRSMQGPGVTARISVGPRFRAVQPPSPGRFGVMSLRPFGRRAVFAGPVAFRHNLRFNIFSGNSCFSSPVFDPFFCQQFFFRNRFLFAQPALPYPYFFTIMNGIIYSKADYWSSGSWTRKIQIADLDVPATLKLNHERGLKFVLPSGPDEVVMRP